MWPKDTLEQRAYHEAGHAVSRVSLGIPFAEVVSRHDEFVVRSGAPHPDFLDTNFSAPDTLEEARKVEWSEPAKGLIRDLMISAAAGPLAQMQFEGRAFPVGTRDFHLFGGASDAGWIEGYALGLACGPQASDHDVIVAKERLVKEIAEAATVLVQAEKGAIENVAQALLRHGRLSAGEVAELCDRLSRSARLTLLAGDEGPP
jgi:hypothetical protein